MLQDGEQRQRATHPTQSFIVQAPAGSGKTEILTQRFLRLLATVTAPEQIIALTFTRKAANEMRERIILALKQATSGINATTMHQQQTLDFALQALARSKQYNWQLLQVPSRLKIMTIDALCQSITQAIPLQEKQLPFASVSEQSKRHFITAARNCIRFAIDNEAYQPSLQTVLLHLDNRQDLLIKLFSSLLVSRDQWLSLLYQGQEQDKAIYEQALLSIEEHALERFHQRLDDETKNELVVLARCVADIEARQTSPRYCLKDWFCFDDINTDQAKALASLLLTTENKFRQEFNHHVGLKKDACSLLDYNDIKNRSKRLLTTLANTPDFLDSLLDVKALPPPCYNDEQWEVLNALFKLLPVLVAHLQLVFAEHNEVDFTSIAQQALTALGTEEQPTDLALYFDHAVHHLLVDEFQDTSISQFQMLSQLVQGWQADEGKTLFVVGDPMQSIYRFRQAEVGLFLRAQQHGIGPVRLTPIELQCNFRSNETVIQWVNQHFRYIFPQFFDIEAGAVSFHASTPVIKKHPESVIEAWQCATREQEAQVLATLIKERLLQYPEENIAILVRSRSQLTDIVHLLRQQHIPYQGIDIDLLAKLPHICDVWSLTKALLMPANRLSWLALLRSPYCGLSLDDLHLLANVNNKTSIFANLSQKDALTQLSEEGQMRATFFYTILHQALATRHQLPLSEWVNQTHKQLKGEKILNLSQQNDLEQFWLLLERLQQDGLLSDLNYVENELKSLYSKQVKPARLQVMTIHKSKGLEFDCVILPCLSAVPNQTDKPLLRWLKLPAQNQEDILLLSPVKGAHQEKCPLYDYLTRLDAQKNDYELQRLLYVAATRAKKSLYLLDHKHKAPQGSFRQLLIHQPFTELEDESSLKNDEASLPVLNKLPLDSYCQDNSVKNEYAAKITNKQVDVNTARITGVITHQLLQHICDNHPASYDEITFTSSQYELKRSGFCQQTQVKLLKQIAVWLQNLFSCPRGQWIIKKHQDESNELELLVEKDGQIVTRIIDRVFVEDNCLWIIDFKTGSDEDITRDKHHKQLTEYADILAHRFEIPIRCGLYYLNTNHWESWNYHE